MTRLTLPNWLAVIRCCVCIHCGADSGCEAHHVSNRGMSQRDHDTGVIPLCHQCHSRHHTTGRGPSLSECRDYLAVVHEGVIQYGLNRRRIPKECTLEDFLRLHIETWRDER